MTRDSLYEKEKRDEIRKDQEEHVKERLTDFIEEICSEFGWETDDVANHNTIKVMIRKAVKK